MELNDPILLNGAIHFCHTGNLYAYRFIDESADVVKQIYTEPLTDAKARVESALTALHWHITHCADCNGNRPHDAECEDYMTQLKFFTHKNDEVTIVVSDVNARGGILLDAADHNGRFSRNSTSRYPQKWSDVKASLIAANIFSALAGEGMERELRAGFMAYAETGVAFDQVMDLIDEIPRA